MTYEFSQAHRALGSVAELRAPLLGGLEVLARAAVSMDFLHMGRQGRGEGKWSQAHARDEIEARRRFFLAPAKTQRIQLSPGNTGRVTSEITMAVPGWTRTKLLWFQWCLPTTVTQSLSGL